MKNVQQQEKNITTVVGLYKLLNKTKRIGIDIDPKYDGVLKMDFFNYIPLNHKKYLCYSQKLRFEDIVILYLVE